MKAKWKLVDPSEPIGRTVYDMVETIRHQYKDDLLEARIGVAWFFGRPTSSDGRLLLGRMKVYGELERLQLNLDGQVRLNYDWWTDEARTDSERLALVHHELCHMGPRLDADGGQERDANDNLLWRVVRHDVEEFRDVVRVHGIWKADLQAFAEGLAEGPAQMTLPGFDIAPSRVLKFNRAA